MKYKIIYLINLTDGFKNHPFLILDENIDNNTLDVVALTHTPQMFDAFIISNKDITTVFNENEKCKKIIQNYLLNSLPMYISEFRTVFNSPDNIIIIGKLQFYLLNKHNKLNIFKSILA